MSPCLFVSAAVLRGVQAPGMALCCGNNNGGACVAGSAHPLAPNMAERAHPGFSAGQLSFPITPPFLFTPSMAMSPALVSHFPTPPHLSHCSHYFCLFLPLVSPLSFIPSFFGPTKAAIHPRHLQADKTSPENRGACTEMPLQSGFFP